MCAGQRCSGPQLWIDRRAALRRRLYDVKEQFDLVIRAQNWRGYTSNLTWQNENGHSFTAGDEFRTLAGRVPPNIALLCGQGSRNGRIRAAGRIAR